MRPIILALSLIAFGNTAEGSDYRTFHRIIVSQERYERFMDMCFASAGNEAVCLDRAVRAGIVVLERVKVNP